MIRQGEMPMDRFRENRPTADILMNSMRAMDYTFESAIADVIDNSISAHSNRIDIKFPTEPSDCFVAICDNGSGMTSKELINAMRYGSKCKNTERAADDLGRFGLGMKSASLSQCRKLTVMSKKNGLISAYIWDMDVVIKNKDWLMIECSEEQICKLRFFDYLKERTSGTVVIWEDFDTIRKNGYEVYSKLCQYAEAVSKYLSLIFHRYLNRNGKEKTEIWINNFRLIGKDPFLENHKKTSVRREIILPLKDSEGVERAISVQPFILPFLKDLTEEDKNLSGGFENYRSCQGFYIYRNERLIIWGTWFGRHRDELTKYARIRVDIPNTLDDIWGIDIKKQRAHIPKSIRKRLTRAVDEAMDIAVKAQKYRGRTEKINNDTDYIWERIKERGGHYTYRINRNSVIFELIRSKINEDTWKQLCIILGEIENSVPYHQIYIDESQNAIEEINKDNDERIAEILYNAEYLIKYALESGINDRITIIENLFREEPFCNYPELKNKLLEEMTDV